LHYYLENKQVSFDKFKKHYANKGFNLLKTLIIINKKKSSYFIIIFMDIKKKKQDRFKFLNKIYEVSNGRISYIVDGEAIGLEFGFDRGYSADIYYYLNEEGLTEPMGAGIRLSLTHYGIKEIEEALSEPNEPTAYFPPINIINIGEMHGGAVQQGTSNSNINITSNDTINNVSQYLDKLNKFADEHLKDNSLQQELKADINTIKQQLKSPKPKKSIIKATIQSVKEVLIGASGGVIGALATPEAKELIQMAEVLITQISN
jgi:hypothetical protein